MAHLNFNQVVEVCKQTLLTPTINGLPHSKELIGKHIDLEVDYDPPDQINEIFCSVDLSPPWEDQEEDEAKDDTASYLFYFVINKEKKTIEIQDPRCKKVQLSQSMILFLMISKQSTMGV
jgi:hypothetical protein